MKKIISALRFCVLASIIAVSCNSTQGKTLAIESKSIVQDTSIIIPSAIIKLDTTEEYWNSKLNENARFVLRDKGTERAFTGQYWDNHDQGIYCCAGCALPLFASETKFESGTGWPSFFKPIRSDCIENVQDKSHGMIRTETVCARCGGHLGHVFEDGPEPTGLRYCMNSVSLLFIPKAKILDK